MRATLIPRAREFLVVGQFVERVVWQLAAPLAGSTHSIKYRLAFVVDGAMRASL